MKTVLEIIFDRYGFLSRQVDTGRLVITVEPDKVGLWWTDTTLDAPNLQLIEGVATLINPGSSLRSLTPRKRGEGIEVIVNRPS